MNIHTIYSLFTSYFRSKRMKLFFDTLNPDENTKILDVGGCQNFWSKLNCSSKITLLNIKISPKDAVFRSKYTYIEGDGTSLPFKDKSFDIVFSNSVIEHLSTYDNQVKFAKELTRVGKNIWVQTPAKYFFVEPHLIAPFIHFLPKNVQKYLIRYFTVWGLVAKPSQKDIVNFLKEVRMLNYKEMGSLFPECMVQKEFFLGMAKSYIAIGLTK